MLAEILPYVPLIAAVAAGVAAIITGVFNLLSQVIQTNREHSRATGLVLSDLLEIRNHFGMLLRMPDVAMKMWKFPDEARPFFEALADHLIAPIQSAPAFDDHLRAMAPGDPLLAHQLQNANMWQSPIFTRVQTLMGSEPDDQAAWRTLKIELTKRVIPIIEGLIRRTAWSHGFSTWVA